MPGSAMPIPRQPSPQAARCARVCSRSAGSTRSSNPPRLVSSRVGRSTLPSARTTPDLSRVPPMSKPIRYPSVCAHPSLATPTRPARSAGGSHRRPRSRSCSARTGTSRGSRPVAVASAAALPAAWPIAMHCAIERTDAWASCVALKQRPATRTLAASRTSSVRNGMSTACPSGRYCQRVSAPA